MFVKVEDLQQGWHVNEAVLASTAHPIILKGTILTEQHIRFLKVFSIEFVDVVPPEENPLSSINSAASLNEFSLTVDMLEQQYHKTVKGIKEEFHKWQSGMNVEIARIRTIILPLLTYVLENPEQLYRISSFSKKEDYLFHHTAALGILCGMIAQKMNYKKGMIVQAALTGVLADSGMSKINYSLLNKKTALTEQEYKNIQNHPIFSYSMVKELRLLKPEVKLAIYQHHERIDGSGYPMGVKGNEIHPIAQIVGLADTYHALTTDRVFQDRQSAFKVIEFIQEDLFGKFDLPIMNALFSIVANLVPGTRVELSDGNKGKVLFVHQMHQTRPLIQLSTGELIDMVKRRDLHIEKVIGKQL
ncbi:HD-GYP domain-containing protein [Domibacillus mangrovi]|nr:HD domain-containing phosphohydrolase [Domibacillus mangrovi]